MTIEQRGGTARMKVEGPRLNLETCESVKLQGKALIESGITNLELDMADVAFVDSSGIGALVALRKAVGDQGSITLVNPSKFVQRVIELTRLHGIFDVHRAA